MARYMKMGTRAQWRQVLALYETCAYCGMLPLVSNEVPIYDVDHVVPRGLGGDDHIWNWVPACRPCNLAKNMMLWRPRILHPWMLPWDHYAAAVPPGFFDEQGPQSMRDAWFESIAQTRRVRGRLAEAERQAQQARPGGGNPSERAQLALRGRLGVPGLTVLADTPQTAEVEEWMRAAYAHEWA